MTPEIKADLERRIAAHPNSGPNYCALTLATKDLQEEFYMEDLPELAARLGVNLYESYGIMHGWDTARGIRPCFAQYAERTGFSEGDEFGREMFAKYGTKREVSK
jgi:hypothetical protein